MTKFFIYIKSLNKTLLIVVILASIFIIYEIKVDTVSTLDTANVISVIKDNEVIDASEYANIMPVQLGTKWIYEGKGIFYDIEKEEDIELVGQKIVEIESIKKEGDNLRVSTLSYYVNNPNFKESQQKLLLISQSGYAFDGNNLAFFPLVKGQKLTPYDFERTDDRYVDYVSSINTKNVLGKEYRCYDILYYGSPDESLEVFCEGIGYVRERYKHYGTPNEWDYKLISVEHPASKDK